RLAQEVLAQLQQLLGRSETLRDFLQQELEAWQERQRRSCLGAPTDTQLRPLEAWFTQLGQGLFQLLQLLQALQDLRQKLTYERDPLKAETPLLERRLRELLSYLLRSAFVVEQQPCMPNAGKRPLVLRTGTKFSARARLLVRLHDRNHRMEATIHIDRLGEGKGSKGTAEVGTGLEQGARGQGGHGWWHHSALCVQGPLAVTEELHLITFTLAYAYRGLELELETSTLPFVIISNTNQLSSAWASILWLNMLSTDPRVSQDPPPPPPPPPP
ncbi:STAT2 protein, partial [Tricholaema leucomelas]|nr:STAT2 protein [Tricholaema leucomelas]